MCAGLVCANWGCQNDLDGIRGVDRPGIDPPRDKFFFPTGLAVTDDGRYLFVTNGNADLNYNGGTVNMIDLQALARKLESGGGPGCSWDPQDPMVLECEESSVIIAQATVRVGHFPGSIEVLQRKPWVPEAEPDGYGLNRLYIPVRGDPSLTYIDVVHEGPERDSPVKCLSCGRGCALSGEKIPDCARAHMVSETPKDTPYSTVKIPAEPYGVFTDRDLRFMYMTHLSNGSISLFDFSNDDVPVLRQVTAEYLAPGLDGRRGGFGVAALRAGDPQTEIVVSNRVAPEMLLFRLQSASLRAAGCSTGFCHGEICSQCERDEDCAGSKQCVFDEEKGYFSCSGGDSVLAESCGDDAECNSGFCTVGTCAQCGADEDCKGVQKCMEGEGGYHVCRAGDRPLGRVCDESEQCESGICFEGRCMDCVADEECPGFQECRPTLIAKGDWARICMAGKGRAGASCSDSPRNPGDGDPLLVLAESIRIRVPFGPLEEVTAGDIRGLAVDDVEDKLYAVSRIPPAVIVMDTSLDDGKTRKEIIDAIDLCLQPSNIRLRRTLDGRLSAYAVCWATGQVYVLDPHSGDLLAVIPVGSGPHDMAFTSDDPWLPASLRSLGFVSVFAENTVAVIDLDPDSPTWNRVIGRIGRPERAVKQ